MLASMETISDTNVLGGMNLVIAVPHNQTSNGLLFHNDDYYYVHNQRYSAENSGRLLMNYKTGHIFDAYYIDNFNMFNCYDLYELQGAAIVNGQIVAFS